MIIGYIGNSDSEGIYQVTWREIENTIDQFFFEGVFTCTIITIIFCDTTIRNWEKGCLYPSESLNGVDR